MFLFALLEIFKQGLSKHIQPRLFQTFLIKVFFNFFNQSSYGYLQLRLFTTYCACEIFNANIKIKSSTHKSIRGFNIVLPYLPSWMRDNIPLYDGEYY